ncbi:MAG: hypothetical protein ACLFU9_01765 [Candidatus Bathyarchaeia archaeon]
MAERKHRKNLSDILSTYRPECFTLTEPEHVEIGSGYSISVEYDKNSKPIICVKKYGDVDTKGLRRELEKNYPGAAIQGLEKRESVRNKGKEKLYSASHSSEK